MLHSSLFLWTAVKPWAKEEGILSFFFFFSTKANFFFFLKYMCIIKNLKGPNRCLGMSLELRTLVLGNNFQMPGRWTPARDAVFFNFFLLLIFFIFFWLKRREWTQWFPYEYILEDWKSIGKFGLFCVC